MTPIQRIVNRSTGVNYNPGNSRSMRNSIMRGWVERYGGRIRGTGDNAYISAS